MLTKLSSWQYKGNHKKLTIRSAHVYYIWPVHKLINRQHFIAKSVNLLKCRCQVCLTWKHCTTSVSNWKMITDSEAGRRGAWGERVTFTLDFIFLAISVFLWYRLLVKVHRLLLRRKSKFRRVLFKSMKESLSMKGLFWSTKLVPNRLNRPPVTQ